MQRDCCYDRNASLGSVPVVLGTQHFLSFSKDAADYRMELSCRRDYHFICCLAPHPHLEQFPDRETARAPARSSDRSATGCAYESDQSTFPLQHSELDFHTDTTRSRPRPVSDL